MGLLGWLLLFSLCIYLFELALLWGRGMTTDWITRIVPGLLRWWKRWRWSRSDVAQGSVAQSCERCGHDH